MYNLLTKVMAKKYANILMFLWYLILLCLVFRYSFIDSGRFKYLGF
jgi:hypothetical protein